ncbi:MAG: Gfo/Idh/MocA family oxidoreductase [Sediminibacterium sp.]
MNFLIVGLGSMGKRRIRNLKAHGHESISGFDQKISRCNEAEERYGIKIYHKWDEIDLQAFDAMIISVPPDIHHIYMKIAVEHKIPCFVEASVVDYGLDEIRKKSYQSGVLVAPSSTMHFHPAIKNISNLIKSGTIGHITNASYHSGQYLPDWHTYEKVKDFYVSQKETGGAREIVPFELTWITKLLGLPQSVMAYVNKTINIEGAEEIDDTYTSMLNYGEFIFNLTVDVTSRCATRLLFINGSDGQLTWNWNDNYVSVFTPKDGWRNFSFDLIEAEQGYDKNITEQMYIDELGCFIDGIINKREFVNNLDLDIKVLHVLYSIEKSASERKEVVL